MCACDTHEGSNFFLTSLCQTLLTPQTGSDHSFSARMTLRNTANIEWGGVSIRRLCKKAYIQARKQYFILHVPMHTLTYARTHTHTRVCLSKLYTSHMAKIVHFYIPTHIPPPPTHTHSSLSYPPTINESIHSKSPEILLMPVHVLWCAHRTKRAPLSSQSKCGPPPKNGSETQCSGGME